MKKRMLAITIVITLMFATASWRLYDVATGNVRKSASSQSSLSLTVAEPRGTIYDCNMRKITNSSSKTVAVVPPSTQAVAAVTTQLDGDAASSALARLKSGKPAVIEVTSDFKCSDAQIFTVDTGLADNQSAAHVVGYINSEGKGVTGIECAYDGLLSESKPLEVTYTVDATGRTLAGVKPKVTGSARSESGVVLTLDSRIQRISEVSAAKHIKKGAVIVMDSDTGEIKAMCSLPNFSPTSVGESLNNPDSPLVNRALSLYNVGSVFKLCVASAALRSGITNLRSYNCSGSLKIGKSVFHCKNHSDYGTMDMTGALERSCNCYFIQLGADVGAKNIYSMCVRFGFNRAWRLADTLTTHQGRLPSESTINEQPAALANMSFGQGDLMLTPLHIAAMTAAITNGGMLVTPSLVKGTTDGKTVSKLSTAAKRRIMSENECAVIKQMMTSVIDEGTGAAAKPEHGTAGGKTASAQTGWKVNGKFVTQAWFTGFYENYTITVLCEDGKSGSVDCAPVFKMIADGIGSFSS